MGTSVLLQRLTKEKDILVVGQKAGVVYGLDPDLWRESAVVYSGPDGGSGWHDVWSRSDAKKIYVPSCRCRLTDGPFYRLPWSRSIRLMATFSGGLRRLRPRVTGI